MFHIWNTDLKYKLFVFKREIWREWKREIEGYGVDGPVISLKVSCDAKVHLSWQFQGQDNISSLKCFHFPHQDLNLTE